MAKFDITAAFQAAVGTAGNVSKLDTSREAIEYISLDKLEADPGNFYRLTGLEDLAANIELCGLQQPVRVRPTEGGRYMIVSGHRRRAALALLAKEDPERWAAVPCLVERDEVSPELRELRLILANSSTRVLSPAEVSKQAQRVETLLYQLKEQGYAFPGRMRDQVAAACKVSAPKLARLKVIREHLIPIYLEHFDRNVLSEQTAYVEILFTNKKEGGEERNQATAQAEKRIARASLFGLETRGNKSTGREKVHGKVAKERRVW